MATPAPMPMAVVAIAENANAGRAHQCTRGESRIADDVEQCAAAPGRRRLFAPPLRAAELQCGESRRVGRRVPVGDVLLRLSLEMKRELLARLVVDAVAADDRSQDMTNAVEERHVVTLCEG